MIALPTLAEVVVEPKKADGLPIKARMGLIFELQAIQTVLTLGLLGAQDPAAPPPARSATLSPQEAAARLGISPTTLLQESRPGRRYASIRVATGSRRVRFSEAGLEALLVPSPFKRKGA